MAQNDEMDVYLGEKQDPEERRQIRLNYRHFIDDIKDQKEDLVKPEGNELNEKLQEADRLFKPVQTAREGVYDSKALSLIASMGRLKAQNLHTEFVRFQPTEFAEKLKTFLGGQGRQTDGSRISALGWCKLGEVTQPFFKRSPPFTFMAGSFERGPLPEKIKQARKSKEKDNVIGKETVPQQLNTFTGNDGNETTTEEVEKVLDILKTTYRREEENPLCFFEFILDPNSFGQTVENIFHVSFLIRDGLASLFLDDDGLPVIKPLEANSNKQSLEGDKERHQAVISITPTDWKDLIETFKVEEATIPSRTSAKETHNRKKSK